MIELISAELDPRVFAITIRGSIERAELDAVASAFEEQLRHHKPLRLYAEVEDVASVSPAALFEDLRLALQHFQDVEQAAIVVDEAWAALLAQFAELVPGLEVRQFSFAEKTQAREWINA